jgi:PTS system mannose-specific IID component
MKVVWLKWTTLLRIFARSLLLQASWNFERLQNLGFLYLMLPGLRSIYGASLPIEVSQRYSGYFNTHPYLAPLVAGSSLRIEARLQAGEEVTIDVETFKKMVMAPFAAMGDALFWGGIRPLAALIGLFFASQGSLWAPVVFLVLYNLPHLVFRGGGLLLGYVQELRAIETIQRCHLPDLAVRFKEMTVILLGVLSAYLAFKGCDHKEISSAWGFALLPVIFLYAWLARKGISSLYLVLVTTVSLLALAVLF